MQPCAQQTCAYFLDYIGSNVGSNVQASLAIKKVNAEVQGSFSRHTSKTGKEVHGNDWGKRQRNSKFLNE